MQRLKELHQYRELLLLMAWRDIKVRYAQTAVGLLWAVIQPVLTLGIFVLVFQRAMQVETGGIPYPVFALPGIVAWGYFASVLKDSGGSVINSAHMIRKIYFPRMVLPLSKAFSAFVELTVGLLLLVGMLLYYGLLPNAGWFMIPVWLLLTLVAALGAGLLVGASTIRFRDIQHVVPFVVQMGLYATPIAWPIEMAPENWRQLLFLNPMTGVVAGFRWSLEESGQAMPEGLWLSAVVAVLLLATGLWAFGRAERLMADLV